MERRIKGLTFDFDDTLVRSFETYGKAILELGERYGYPKRTLQDLQNHWGKKFPEVIKGLWTMSDHEAEAFIETWQADIPPAPAEIGNLRQLVDACHERRIALGIVTSRNSDTLTKGFESLSVPQERFTFIQCGDQTPHEKDDPRCFEQPLKTFSHHGIARGEVIHIGDSLYDYRGARDAGIGFIAVLTGPTTREEFLEAGVPEYRIIDSVNSLTATLDSL